MGLIALSWKGLLFFPSPFSCINPPLILSVSYVTNANKSSSPLHFHASSNLGDDDSSSPREGDCLVGTKAKPRAGRERSGRGHRVRGILTPSVWSPNGLELPMGNELRRSQHDSTADLALRQLCGAKGNARWAIWKYGYKRSISPHRNATYIELVHAKSPVCNGKRGYRSSGCCGVGE